jgi:hypothetical protein
MTCQSVQDFSRRPWKMDSWGISLSSTNRKSVQSGKMEQYASSVLVFSEKWQQLK